MRRAAAGALVSLVLGAAAFGPLAGCGLLRPKPAPEARFGDRAAAEDAEVLSVTAPDSGRAYFYSNAPVEYEGVVPRVEAAPTAEGARVELFVRGAFPDACYELHDVAQTRRANYVDVTLRVRRPQGAVCATVVRPYRFYLVLDGRFAPGPYVVTVNGTAYPFEVHALRGS